MIFHTTLQHPETVHFYIKSLEIVGTEHKIKLKLTIFDHESWLNFLNEVNRVQEITGNLFKALVDSGHRSTTTTINNTFLNWYQDGVIIVFHETTITTLTPTFNPFD